MMICIEYQIGVAYCIEEDDGQHNEFKAPSEINFGVQVVNKITLIKYQDHYKDSHE